MSTDNAARFYWGKLERATAIFEKGNNEEAKDICCQLINGFRCPRFCQVDARKLLSRCYHDNYWFAKSSLDRALEICVSCESYDGATKLDLQALADLKESVEAMLRDRLRVYCEYWAAKGRKPPSEDEWQEITEPKAEAQDTTDGCYEVVKDEKGNPLSGPVKAWPFKGPVPSSFLLGKTFPPQPKGLTAEELQKHEEQVHQYEEEQDYQEIEEMEIAMKEVGPGAEEAAQKLNQLKISAGMDVDDGPQVKGAPLSPAGSEK